MMRRLGLLEIHDHPAFPTLLRDLVTDGVKSGVKEGTIGAEQK